jgi:hypothetical protein
LTWHVNVTFINQKKKKDGIFDTAMTTRMSLLRTWPRLHRRHRHHHLLLLLLLSSLAVFLLCRRAAAAAAADGSGSARAFEEDVTEKAEAREKTPADADGPTRSQYRRDAVLRMLGARVVAADTPDAPDAPDANE